MHLVCTLLKLISKKRWTLKILSGRRRFKNFKVTPVSSPYTKSAPKESQTRLAGGMTSCPKERFARLGPRKPAQNWHRKIAVTTGAASRLATIPLQKSQGFRFAGRKKTDIANNFEGHPQNRRKLAATTAASRRQSAISQPQRPRDTKGKSQRQTASVSVHLCSSQPAQNDFSQHDDGWGAKAVQNEFVPKMLCFFCFAAPIQYMIFLVSFRRRQ